MGYLKRPIGIKYFYRHTYNDRPIRLGWNFYWMYSFEAMIAISELRHQFKGRFTSTLPVEQRRDI